MLNNNILNAQYFLFIGIPFDQWFVHLFMRILKQDQERTTKYAAGRAFSPEEIQSSEEQYNIRFINSGIKAFVDELYERAESENLIKAIETKKDNTEEKQSLFDQVRDWIMHNEFKRVADKLKNLLRGAGQAGKPHMLITIQLAGRHRDIEEQSMMGLLRYEDQMVEMNRLRKDFLNALDRLQEDWDQLNIRL